MQPTHEHRAAPVWTSSSAGRVVIEADFMQQTVSSVSHLPRCSGFAGANGKCKMVLATSPSALVPLLSHTPPRL